MFSIEHVKPTTTEKIHNTTSRINKGALKANALLLGVDLANDIYEHADEIREAADLIPYLADYAGRYADDVAGFLMTVLEHGDYSNLLPTISSILGVPLAARTIDNVADLLGIESNAQGAVRDFEEKVGNTIIKPVVDAVPDSVKTTVKEFNQASTHGGFLPAAQLGQLLSQGANWLGKQFGWR